MTYDNNLINKVLSYTRNAITGEMRRFIQEKGNEIGAYTTLYDLVLDYPMREGKMLRPAICISVARAVGGIGQSAITIAAALELYHNAFLIKDDFEDESETRRGQETLHRKLGIPRAMNVGDTTNVLAVGMILENLEILGVGKTLHILQEIELMVRQSVEGQAMELDWRYFNDFNLGDQDYFTMCVKKTCWYTFMSPCRIGLIAGSFSLVTEDFKNKLSLISEMAMHLGLAFQIQDDQLNLKGDLEKYGKEIGGDIYEGKRTIMLNHVLTKSKHRNKIMKILNKKRINKTKNDVHFIIGEMKNCGSFLYSNELAKKHALKASSILESLEFLELKTPVRPDESWELADADRRFLKEVINFVIYRNH